MIMNLNALNANEISRDCLIYGTPGLAIEDKGMGLFSFCQTGPWQKKRRGSHPVITSTLLFIISYR